MNEPLVLYSTASLLAFRIARRYYQDVHYAWCSPVFDGRTTGRTGPVIPPTSSPCEIYWTFFEHVRRGDEHSDAILRNRQGIRFGAQAKYDAEAISLRSRDDILSIVGKAKLEDFRPLLLIIPMNAQISRLVTDVPPDQRAHPLSEELLIPSLPRAMFDVIELGIPA